MIHHAEPSRDRREEVGWGRFPENPDTLLACPPETVTVIYQGTLAKGEFLRAQIPFPNVPVSSQVEITATLCIQAATDPEHVINYTRSGMQVTFRPRYGVEDMTSADFFGRASQYKTERESRDDGHKWETVLHRRRKFSAETLLSDPVFDLRYHARQTSRGVPAASAPDIQYAMAVSVRVEGLSDIYNLIRQRYQVLQPVQLRAEVPLSST
jgi:hypothetical protein